MECLRGRRKRLVLLKNPVLRFLYKLLYTAHAMNSNKWWREMSIVVRKSGLRGKFGLEIISSILSHACSIEIWGELSESNFLGAANSN